jgi:hypothetical protein
MTKQMTAHIAYQKSNRLGERQPDLEHFIITKAVWSYHYAQNVIKGRFIEGESIISTAPESSYYYAKRAIKGRWKLGEAAIASSEDFSGLYADYVLKKDFLIKPKR